MLDGKAYRRIIQPFNSKDSFLFIASYRDRGCDCAIIVGQF